jgi:hypothetical protein
MSDQSANSPLPQANQTANVVSDDRAVGAVVPSVVKSIASSPPVTQQPEPQTPARAKEMGSQSSESSPLLEVNTGAAAIEQEPIPEEVEAWMEKVGGQGETTKLENLPAVQVSAPAKQPVASSSQAFVLPLGEAEVDRGNKASVNDSIKWLATWCQKLIKQLRGQVVYRGN